MNIRWNNIAILLLTILIAFLLLRYGGLIGNVVNHIERIGPGHSTDEQTLGLLALGLIGVALVAIIRLLTNSRASGSRPPDSEDPPAN